MDKSWMHTNRMKRPYIDGVATFLKYAVHQLKILRNMDPENTAEKIQIPCPCVFCLNHYTLDVDEVDHHLFSKGIDPNYTNWTKHGETDETSRRTHANVDHGQHIEDYADSTMGIPTDAPETIEMVQATEENFVDAHEKDAYDDVDEEFSTVILPQNDNIMPRVDPLDLGMESRDDYFRADCRADQNKSADQIQAVNLRIFLLRLLDLLAIVAEIDIIIVGSGIIKDANPADAAREAAAEVVVKYRICADLSEVLLLEYVYINLYYLEKQMTWIKTELLLQKTNGYDSMQVNAMVAGYKAEWQKHHDPLIVVAQIAERCSTEPKKTLVLMYKLEFAQLKVVQSYGGKKNPKLFSNLFSPPPPLTTLHAGKPTPPLRRRTTVVHPSLHRTTTVSLVVHHHSSDIIVLPLSPSYHFD
ncbi:hypothetical protein L6452_19583 [Arctium lappa]|uniref:Uncharacterized protein n=1 Tax=Arctium lappa TaxID=4217 RepID=A0ACB9B890_ARCLA|nr:hypothetical protein L6452_19583 [Arctium lappa]